MAANLGSRAAGASKALNRISVLGPAPLLEGEDASAYAELLAQVSSAVKPTDIIEDIWVRDVVDLTWEILRWRRLKANLLSSGIPYHLGNILAPLVNKPVVNKQPAATEETDNLGLDLTMFRPSPPSAADKLASKWAAHDPAARSRVERLVVSSKLSMDSVFARALMDRFDDIERIDRLTMILEGRRNSVLREIDRRRASFAQMLRGTVKEIEDAEFETVEPKTIAVKNAANKNAA